MSSPGSRISENLVPDRVAVCILPDASDHSSRDPEARDMEGKIGGRASELRPRWEQVPQDFADPEHGPHHLPCAVALLAGASPSLV